MAITIAALYRYPVKGLSAEALVTVPLAPSECLPHDRRFALALPSTRFDPEHAKWLPKTCFAMLMRDEKLAELETRFDPQTEDLTIRHRGALVLRARLTDPAGRQAVSRFMAEFLGDSVEQPLRVVAAPNHSFADARKKPNATADKYVSLINRSSLAALEAVIGAEIDPLRFRANVYFDGAAAWEELGWIERRIALGGARLRVVSAITRCAATEVNPTSARRDLHVVAALQQGFGHNLMGVYAEVIEGGDIALHDRLTVQASAP